MQTNEMILPLPKHYLIHNLTAILISFGIVGCEGVIGSRGYIYSANMEPLSNVQIDLYANNTLESPITSDSLGFFFAESLVGCIPSCPSSKLVFKKIGYQSLVIDIDSAKKSHLPGALDSLIIKLEPIE